MQRDRGQRLRLFFDLHPFFRFDRLMQTVTPLATFHHASGVVVDDDDFIIAHDVTDIVFVEVMRLQGVVDQMRPLHVARRVEALHAGEFFRVAHAQLGEMARVFLFLQLEVQVAFKLSRQFVGHRVLRHVVVGTPGDDQRCAGFVDQDVVDLIDDRVVEPPLNLLVLERLHVVAQVVEAELVVRSVSDVAAVGDLFFVLTGVGLNRTDGQAETHVQRSHPFHVALGQVVVDRDDMHRTGHRIQERRERRHQCLAFPGDHLGDHPLMQDVAAHHLHVVVAHLEIAFARFTHGGESIGNEILQRLSICQPSSQARSGLTQFAIGEEFQLRLKLVDSFQDRTGEDNGLPLLVARVTDGLHSPFVRRTEHAGDESLGTSENHVDRITHLVEEFHDSSVEMTRGRVEPAPLFLARHQHDK